MAWIIASVLLLLLLVQAVPWIAFANVLRRRWRTPTPDAECPRAAVVLCLRGRDPFLEECLERVLKQDYPEYVVHVVVDRMEDPAWEVVRQVASRARPGRIRLEPLTRRYDTCALKCSSILQAVDQLDETVELVAMLDGDTLPHATWLRELVAPFEDPRVGVASGNRWYMPARPSWGALVRYVWNAAAVVQMYWNSFTWGGSVALRAELARSEEMRRRWRSSVSSDTVIYEVVRQRGYETAFVPTLMMVNREDTDLGRFGGWLARQMVVARLYHPGWLPILAHGILSTLAAVAAVGLLALSAAWGDRQATIVLAAAFALYLSGCVLLFALLEWAVRAVVRSRGEPAGWLTPSAACKLLVALPLTQFLYAATLVYVLFMRKVTWRGATYQLEGRRRVRLVEDAGLQADHDRASSVI